MIWILILIVLLLFGGGIWAWPVVAGMLGLSAVRDKPGALEHIRQLMKTYEITPGEVEAAFLAPSVAEGNAAQRNKGDVAKTLFTYLGSIFILAGIGTYIGMFWDSMGAVMRVVVTLGIGYTLLIVLFSALYEAKYPRAILPLTLTSIVMMFSGWFVLIHELFPDGENWRAASLFVCGVMALQWGVLFAKFQRTIFAFTTLFFIYAFMHLGLDLLGVSYTFIAIMLGSSLFLVGSGMEKTQQRVLTESALVVGALWLYSGLFDLLATEFTASWASFLIGISLALTAYGLHRANRHSRLIGLGYLIGSMMFYAGLFDLVEGTPIDLIFLVVTAILLYACVTLQSKALLLTTVLAMLSYIGYLSGEYFADSLGWPVTLVLMGVAFLAVGTVALKLKKQI